MFSYQRNIFLRETDATGVLYFSEQLKIAQEALEAYFFSKKLTLHQMIDQDDFLLPTVHVEADYLAPLRVGDQVDVHLSLEATGTSSFTLITEIRKDDALVGTTKIVHVAISKKTGKSIPIPELVLGHLREL